MKDSYAGNVLRIQTNTLGKTVKLVSSNQLKNIQGQKKFITLITVKDFVKDYLTLMKLEKVQLASNPAMAQALSRTKPFSYQMILGFTSGFEFMGFFLGIAFLTMLASTLMFKVLSGAASDKIALRNALIRLVLEERCSSNPLDTKLACYSFFLGSSVWSTSCLDSDYLQHFCHIHTWASGYHSQSSLFSTSSTMPLQLNCMKTLFCKNR